MSSQIKDTSENVQAFYAAVQIKSGLYPKEL
jgi:hypothetical protein